ncbi:MAG: type II secretion system protein [Candidatus Omnitrophica bacterium]|nr:type II secretion system protein [Candidatus Omnitrophota bacterium]MDD5356112.1 type II secretion system protein [Candidatus Omnitrophota bacterium]
MKTKDTTRKVKGFTIIESILVIAILGIVASIGVPLILSASDAISFLTVRNDMAQSADVAMSRMLNDIRRIRDDVSVDTAAASQFRFFDTDDTDINYYLNSNNLMRGSNILASGVNSIIFIYYDEAGSQLSPPIAGIGTQTDIYRVKITFVFNSGSYTFSYQSQVEPRNLR